LRAEVQAGAGAALSAVDEGRVRAAECGDVQFRDPRVLAGGEGRGGVGFRNGHARREGGPERDHFWQLDPRARQGGGIGGERE